MQWHENKERACQARQGSFWGITGAGKAQSRQKGRQRGASVGRRPESSHSSHTWPLVIEDTSVISLRVVAMKSEGRFNLRSISRWPMRFS